MCVLLLKKIKEIAVICMTAIGVQGGQVFARAPRILDSSFLLSLSDAFLKAFSSALPSFDASQITNFSAESVSIAVSGRSSDPD